MVNNTNRQGIAEYAKLVDETRDYERKTKEMEIEIASYSALTRIEQRAKELGLEKAKRVEYLR